MTIEIPLTRGYVAIVDAEDSGLAERKWHACVTTSGNVYATTRDGPGGKRIKLHQAIMKPPPGLVVDHINRNTMDNRRANLRVVANAVNIRNSIHCDNSGVRFDVKTGRWYARIKWNRVRVFLGRLDTEVEARSAVASAKEMLEGGHQPKAVSAIFRDRNRKPKKPRADEWDFMREFLAEMRTDGS